MSPNATGGRPQIVKNGTINKDRRDFLKTAALVGGSALVTGVPLVSYFTAPALSKGTGKWVDFGPSGGPRTRQCFDAVLRVFDQRRLVSPAAARHCLGQNRGGRQTDCLFIGLHPSELQRHMAGRNPGFRMSLPCRPFDVNGRPISGPPKKPLTVLEHKLRMTSLLTLLTL